MTTQTIQQFWQQWRGKRVAVCGIGHNNLPVIYQFLDKGVRVLACDRRGREELGETAAELEQRGAELSLGEGYLAHLDVDMILRTPGMKPYLPEFEQARKRGIPVTSEMELFFSLCPAPIYGVTGSDGKTTTTTIIAGLLKAAGKRVHLGGNIGRSLLPVIEQVDKQDVVVVELSSFQLTGMSQSPHVAVITNVAPNHLDWHTDMQEYIDAKRNLMLHQKPGDRVVLNADNEVTASFAGDAAGEVCLFSRRHGVERGGFLGEDNILYMREGGRDTPVMKREDILIPGDHNVENYLAAIAAVWGQVNPDTIAAYARSFSGVEHRCELVRTRRGVKWYNDSIGSSPSRTIAGLKAFDRRVILIAGGYDKHIPYDPLGPVAAQKVKAAILMGATGDKIEQAIRACSDLPITRVADMQQAVAAADRMAGEGDIVFMSPASASFDMYRNFMERGDHFRRLVQELEE